MKSIYNEVLELEMDELLKPLYEYGYEFRNGQRPCIRHRRICRL